MENKEHQIVNRAIRNHIRFMTRMEKAFYSAIVLTAIVMSISVVYLQGCNQAIKNQITDLNRKISDEKTELNNAKQAVNELTNSDRIKEIATKAGLSINNERFMTEMGMFWLRIQPVIPFMLLYQPAMCHQLGKNSMYKRVSLIRLPIF